MPTSPISHFQSYQTVLITSIYTLWPSVSGWKGLKPYFVQALTWVTWWCCLHWQRGTLSFLPISLAGTQMMSWRQSIPEKRRSQNGSNSYHDYSVRMSGVDDYICAHPRLECRGCACASRSDQPQPTNSMRRRSSNPLHGWRTSITLLVHSSSLSIRPSDIVKVEYNTSQNCRGYSKSTSISAPEVLARVVQYRSRSLLLPRSDNTAMPHIFTGASRRNRPPFEYGAEPGSFFGYFWIKYGKIVVLYHVRGLWMSGGEAWGLHNFKRWKIYLKFTRAWVWLSYGCHHRLENMLLQPIGQTSQEFAHLEHFSKETWRITPHPSIDCNLRCYWGEPRVTSSFPSIIQSLPHHLLLSHLCQAPGSNHQCLFSVAERASIRVHLFLSSSDPELIQTHPSNLPWPIYPELHWL